MRDLAFGKRESFLMNGHFTHLYTNRESFAVYGICIDTKNMLRPFSFFLKLLLVYTSRFVYAGGQRFRTRADNSYSIV